MPLADLFTPLTQMGFLPGTVHLNAPAGGVRPFGRGEYMDNPDGSWSSEMTYTLSDPSLNAGRPTVLPGLWLKQGRPYHANEDEAAQMAAQSGLHFPSYSSMDLAEAIANARENAWQKVPRERAAMAAPLFVNPMGPP